MSANQSAPSNLSILGSMSQTMGEIQAEKATSELPPDGQYQFQVLLMSIRDSVLKIGEGATLQEIPSLRVSFQYETRPGAPGLTETVKCWGAGFDLINQATFNALPESGRKKALEINQKRFKGHLEVLSGHVVTAENFAQTVAEVQNIVDSPAAIVVEAVVRRNKDGKYPTETLSRRIAV